MNSFRKHIKKKLSGYEPEVNDMALHEGWKQTEQLLNRQNESRNRLNNFEPETEDDLIHKKWEAIIPYLPEEKKKRAMFYIPLGCLFPGLLLLLPMLFVTQYYFRSYHEKPAQVSETQAGNGNGEAAVIKQKGASSENTPEFNTSKSITGLKEPSDEADKISPTEKAVATGHHLLNKDGLQEPELLFSDAEQLSASMVTETAGIMDSVYFMNSLYCFPARSVSDSVLKNTFIHHDTVPPKRSSRFSVDVTAGMAQSFTIVRFDSAHEMNSQKANLCISAALHYKLNKRILLSGQVSISDNRYEYKFVETKNFILSKVLSTTSSSPGSIDSSIKYMPFNRVYQLRPVFNCQAGIGTEVSLLNTKKLSLSAAVLVQFSMTQFNYSYSYRPSGDTLSYIKQASSPPLPNTTKDTEAENRDLKFLKTNVGFYPGLVIGYRLSNKTDLIVKPGMYVDLKELKPRHITYNQNVFLLTAGIRIRL